MHLRNVRARRMTWAIKFIMPASEWSSHFEALWHNRTSSISQGSQTSLGDGAWASIRRESRKIAKNSTFVVGDTNLAQLIATSNERNRRMRAKWALHASWCECLCIHLVKVQEILLKIDGADLKSKAKAIIGEIAIFTHIQGPKHPAKPLKGSLWSFNWTMAICRFNICYGKKSSQAAWNLLHHPQICRGRGYS